MSLISAFAIYFIIWWLVLFAVLPIGEGIELSSLWLATAISLVAAVIVFRTV